MNHMVVKWVLTNLKDLAEALIRNMFYQRVYKRRK